MRLGAQLEDEMVKTLGCAMLGLVAVGFLACGPGVDNFAITPRYYCDNDKIDVSWQTHGMKDVRLVDKDGNALVSGNSTQGSFSASRSQMPLDMRANVKGEDVSLRAYNPLLADFLLWTENVDQEYWTNQFVYDVKQGPDSAGATKPPGMSYTFSRSTQKGVRQEPVGQKQTIDCIPQSGPTKPNGATQEVKKEWDALTAVSWTFGNGLFGSKCKAIAVENCTNQEVTVSFGGETLDLAANSNNKFKNEHATKGTLEFKLKSPVEVLARQNTLVLPDECRGNGTTPQCTTQTGVPVECPSVMPFGCMRLQVRCDQP